MGRFQVELPLLLRIGGIMKTKRLSALCMAVLLMLTMSITAFAVYANVCNFINLIFITTHHFLRNNICKFLWLFAFKHFFSYKVSV